MISVLYFGDPPESTARYLRLALKKHCSVEYVNPLTDKFPLGRLGHGQCDAVILSDVGRSRLGRHVPRRIKTYVQDGGGLLMIGGFASFAGHKMKGNYHNSEIEEALPVECSSVPDDVAVYRGFHPATKTTNHPIMREDIPWDDFPVLVGYNRVKAKEGTAILLEYDRDPILSVHPFGQGRSAAFASDCAPHWCGGLVDWPHYDRFWYAIARWLARET